MSENGKGFTRCYLLMLSLCITVTASQHRSWNDHSRNPANASKDKDKWGWGYEEPEPKSDGWAWGYLDPEQITPSVHTTPNNEKIKKLCSPYNPRMPNFNIKGRRISETKCYEYIWELQTRYKRHLKSSKCVKALYKNDEFQQYVEIIRGRKTEPGQFPHMGAIGWLGSRTGWVFKCGSSLISSKFVLTAGYCSRASDRDTSIANPVPKIIRLGDKNIIDVYTNGVAPTDAIISHIIVHPKYHPPKKYYDLALMELEDHVVFSKFIQPACLWTRFDTNLLGKKAILTGWGVVETIGKITSPELQTAVVNLIDTPTCDRLLKPSCDRNWCGVRDNQICAGKLAGGVDACQGDSGAPLQLRIPLSISSEGGMHYVVGVTSFGIGCGLPTLPGIYSRVAMYLDWIELVIWPTL